MTNAEVAFAVIVGAISAAGLVLGSWLTSGASDRAAKLSAQGLERQIVLNSKAKIAEFRQAWINNLRDAMARFIALGSDVKRRMGPEMVEAGTRIQLMMNRGDKRYPRLTESMSDFVYAIGSEDRQYDPNPFVELCQDILKDEWEVLKKELLELDSSR